MTLGEDTTHLFAKARRGLYSSGPSPMAWLDQLK